MAEARQRWNPQDGFRQNVALDGPSRVQDAPPIARRGGNSATMLEQFFTSCSGLQRCFLVCRGRGRRDKAEKARSRLKWPEKCSRRSSALFHRPAGEGGPSSSLRSVILNLLVLPRSAMWRKVAKDGIPKTVQRLSIDPPGRAGPPLP